MKVRWTSTSVRFRITPSELESISAGTAVVAELAVPGGRWRATLDPSDDNAKFTFTGGDLVVRLTSAEIEQLNEPDREGVYLDDDGIQLIVEKDFPCAHPRDGQDPDQPGETFTAPADFEARKA